MHNCNGQSCTAGRDAEHLPLSAHKKERTQHSQKAKDQDAHAVPETQVVSFSLSTYACITTLHMIERFVKELLSGLLLPRTKCEAADTKK